MVVYNSIYLTKLNAKNDSSCKACPVFPDPMGSKVNLGKGRGPEANREEDIRTSCPLAPLID